MSRALWLLLWLQLRGWLRFIGRSLRTVRGALLASIGVGVIGLWLLAVLVTPPEAGGLRPLDVERYGPALLLLYCVANVVFSSHERAVYFTPAEVQFLFPGPFGRRERLGYKVILTALVSVPATLFMGAVLRVRQGWWPAVLLGLLLTSLFMQLFSMALSLLASAAGERLYGVGRKVAVGLIVLVAGVVIVQARGPQASWELGQLAKEALHTEAWRVVSAPLRSFFDVMVARELNLAFLTHLAIAASVLCAVVLLIFSLDAQYEEAAAAASARVYAKIQRMRGRSVTVEEATRPTKAGWSVPMPPYWGGVGPIFWRQLTGAVRGLGRLLWVLFVLGVVLAGPVLGSGVSGEPGALWGAVIGVGVWLALFLTTLVPYDFRGDIDRLAALKALPIAPWRLALGQLLTPTLLLALMQWLALALALVMAPEEWHRLLVVAAFVPVVTFVIVGLENLLFLLFPVRVMAATPGDFQAVGRNVLLAMGKLVGLLAVAAAATVAALPAALLTGSFVAAALAAWPVVAAAGAALVPLCGLAFTWFDVGRDTPA
jgi:hypothetical protein